MNIINAMNLNFKKLGRIHKMHRVEFKRVQKSTLTLAHRQSLEANPKLDCHIGWFSS